MGRQFDAQRYATDGSAHVSDRRPGDRLGGHVVAQPGVQGRVREEALAAGTVGVERRGPDHRLAVEAQRHPTGHDPPRVRTAAHQRDDHVGRLVGDPVDAVEHEQRRAPTGEGIDNGVDHVTAAARRNVQHGGEGGDDLAGVTHRVELDQRAETVETVVGVGDELGGEARLADAARTGDGHDSTGADGVAQCRQFPLPPDKRPGRADARKGIGLGAEDGEAQVGRRPLGRDPEIVGQGAATGVVGPQGSRPIAAAT